MELNSYPDLSPEHSYAYKIAAKELVKYCLEFDLWRQAERCNSRPTQDPRRRGILVPHLAERPTPPEPHSAD